LVYITGIQLVSGGTRPEHISNVMWLNGDTGKADRCSTARMIQFIDQRNLVQVGGPNGPVAVRVARPTNGAPYLRTTPDNTTRDNLLELPRY
jgi:hypothetical protein